MVFYNKIIYIFYIPNMKLIVNKICNRLLRSFETHKAINKMGNLQYQGGYLSRNRYHQFKRKPSNLLEEPTVAKIECFLSKYVY